MGLSQPVPVSATYDFLADFLVVTFDRTLVPGPVTGSTFTFRANLARRRAINATATGATVTANSVFVAADPGPNVVTYAPPPFDVVDLATGGLAQSFADFPLSVI